MISEHEWRERLGAEQPRILPELVAMLIVALEYDEAQLILLGSNSAVQTLRAATGKDLIDDMREILPTLFPPEPGQLVNEMTRILGKMRER